MNAVLQDLAHPLFVRRLMGFCNRLNARVLRLIKCSHFGLLLLVIISIPSSQSANGVVQALMTVVVSPVIVGYRTPRMRVVSVELTTRTTSDGGEVTRTRCLKREEVRY